MRIIINVLLSFLLIMILVFPRSYSLLKLPFLITSILLILLYFIKRKKILLSVDFITYFFTYIFVSLITIFVGSMYGNESTALYDMLRLNIIYIFLYSIICIYISRINIASNFDFLVAFSSILISFLNILLIISTIKGTPFFSKEFIDEMKMNIGIHEGYIQITSHNVGMYLFTIPFMITRLYGGNSPHLSFLKFSLIISILVMLLSSRRAILVVTLLTPIIVLVIYLLIGKLNYKMIKQFSYLVLIFIVTTISFSVYFNSQYPEAFESFYQRINLINSELDDSPRLIQSKELIKSVAEKPLMGHGYGAVTNIVRSDTRPWVYELTYIQMLFNMGIILFTFVITNFLYYIFKTIKRIKTVTDYNFHTSLLCGAICIFLGSITNPYLASFDFMFVLIIMPYIIQYSYNSKNL